MKIQTLMKCVKSFEYATRLQQMEHLFEKDKQATVRDNYTKTKDKLEKTLTKLCTKLERQDTILLALGHDPKRLFQKYLSKKGQSKQ